MWFISLNSDKTVEEFNRLYNLMKYLQDKKDDYIMPKYYMPRLKNSKYRGIHAFKEFCKSISEDCSYVKKVITGLRKAGTWYVMNNYIAIDSDESVKILIDFEYRDDLVVNENDPGNYNDNINLEIDFVKSILEIVDEEKLDNEKIKNLIIELVNKLKE